MLKESVRIFAVIILLVAAASIAGANPDPKDGKKIYHNEKWDIMLLYPDDWTYIEEYRKNVPVVMSPPKEEEPDGFLMVFFIGEKLFENLEDFSKHFEEKYLKVDDNYKIIGRQDGETKEGYATLDYRYTFEDSDKTTIVSDCRLTITEGEACWMISYDRPSDGSEAVEKEAIGIIGSVIFAPAEYLTREEE